MFFKDSKTKALEQTMEQNINRELIEATQVIVRSNQGQMSPFDNQMYGQQNQQFQQMPQQYGQQQYVQPQQYGEQQYVQPQQGGQFYGTQQQMPMQNSGAQGKQGVPQGLPKFILNEYKNVMMFSIITIIVALAIIAIGGYFGLQAWNDGEREFTGYIAPAVAVLIGFYKFIDALLTWRSAKKDSITVKNDFANGFHSIPRFITRIYRDLSVRSVDINWFCIVSYVLLGGFLLVTNKLQGFEVPVINYVIDFTHIKLQIDAAKIAIVSILFLHIALLFWYKLRKERINSFYGFEIVPHAEIAELKKTRNQFFRRILKILFLLIFIVFVIVYKFAKRRK